MVADLVVVPVSMTVEAVQTPPNIDVDPLSMASAQAADTQVQQTLTISNTGGGTLTWVIDEDVSGSPDFVDWSDNFDSYATGSQLVGQGGWRRSAPTTPTAGALTSSAQALRVLPTRPTSSAPPIWCTSTAATPAGSRPTSAAVQPAGFTGQSVLRSG